MARSQVRQDQAMANMEAMLASLVKEKEVNKTTPPKITSKSPKKGRKSTFAANFGKEVASSTRYSAQWKQRAETELEDEQTSSSEDEVDKKTPSGNRSNHRSPKAPYKKKGIPRRRKSPPKVF